MNEVDLLKVFAGQGFFALLFYLMNRGSLRTGREAEDTKKSYEREIASLKEQLAEAKKQRDHYEEMAWASVTSGNKLASVIEKKIQP